MNGEESIAQRIDTVGQNIFEAALRAGVDQGKITLVAVSKKQPLEKMLDYQRELQRKGQIATFGENYVNEFKEKRPSLLSGFRAHMIGPLQRNKVKDAVALFDCIESVHSEEVVRAINKEAQKQGKVQNVFLQVNISADPQKAGFMPEQIDGVIELMLAELPHVALTGLMTITRYYEQREDVRPDFRAMRKLRDDLYAGAKFAGAWRGGHLDLSMGMSADYDIAIEEGATVVRVGTALFGERK